MKRWDVQGYSFVTDIGQFVKHADYVQVETTLHNWIDKAGGYRCRIDQLESERDTLRAELAKANDYINRMRDILTAAYQCIDPSRDACNCILGELVSRERQQAALAVKEE